MLSIGLAVLVVLAAVPALWHIRALVILWQAQVPYPMDLEWMEGGALYHAWRFAHGQSIYGPPSQGFVPYPYPPLHFVCLGAIGTIFGFGYTPARLFSVLCIVVAIGVLVREVYQHAKDWKLGVPLGVLFVGAVGASIPLVQGWYALIRNDSLAIVVPIVAASLCLRNDISRSRILVLAALLTASVYAKQTGAFFAAWIVGFLTLRNRRTGVLVAAATALLCGLLLGLLQVTSHGWFLRYMLMQGNHPINATNVPMGLWDISKTAPYLPALPIVAAYLLGRRTLPQRSILWTGMLAAAFPATLLPYMKAGGCSNNLIPIVLIAGPVALLLALDVARSLAKQAHASLVLTAFAILFGLLLYEKADFDPLNQAPDARLREDAQKLQHWVARLPGSVLTLDHPMLAVLAGKTTEQLHSMPIRDAADGRLPGANTAAFLRSAAPDWIIADEGWMDGEVAAAVDRYYVESGRVPVQLRMPIATQAAPRRLLRRKPSRQNVRTVFDFEGPRLDGWIVSGNAFADGTTTGIQYGQSLIRGFEGERLANSFRADLGDKATGEATSPAFVIDRSRMSLLVAGGDSGQARVELLVDGRWAAETHGSNSDLLNEVIWNVEPHLGRVGRLFVSDRTRDPMGHIMLDHVELFDERGAEGR